MYRTVLKQIYTLAKTKQNKKRSQSRSVIFSFALIVTKAFWCYVMGPYSAERHLPQTLKNCALNVSACQFLKIVSHTTKSGCSGEVVFWFLGLMEIWDGKDLRSSNWTLLAQAYIFPNLYLVSGLMQAMGFLQLPLGSLFHTPVDS